MITTTRFSIVCCSFLILACDNARAPASDSTAASSAAAPAPDQGTSPAPAANPTPTPIDSAASPAEVLREYYAAIQSRDYTLAYSLWSDRGRASKQTREQFAAGFAETATVSFSVRDSIRVEGAAGSQYATVPVVVDATQRDGRRQHFEGSYTLRRSWVDGATPEQRQWRIYSASLASR